MEYWAISRPSLTAEVLLQLPERESVHNPCIAVDNLGTIHIINKYNCEPQGQTYSYQVQHWKKSSDGEFPIEPDVIYSPTEYYLSSVDAELSPDDKLYVLIGESNSRMLFTHNASSEFTDPTWVFSGPFGVPTRVSAERDGMIHVVARTLNETTDVLYYTNSEFASEPPNGPPHIEEIVMSKKTVGKKKKAKAWTATAKVLVHDENLNPLSGAVVGGTFSGVQWTSGSVLNVTRRATTDRNGYAKLTSPEYQSGEITFTVLYVTKSDWKSYDAVNDPSPPSDFISNTLRKRVADLTQIDIPSEFSLLGNRPNPFNSTTTIEYSLAEACHVKIVVYNTLGQQVADLVDATQPVGLHSAIWDASGLPSGVYLYRMDAERFTATKKMFFLK